MAKYELRILADTPQELMQLLMGNSAGLVALNTIAAAGGNSQGAAATTGDDEADDNSPGDTNQTHDARGIPWDARIHSSNHKTNAKDGAWRKARGVTDAQVAAVEQELHSKGLVRVPGQQQQPAPSPIAQPQPMAAIPQQPVPMPQIMQPPAPAPVPMQQMQPVPMQQPMQMPQTQPAPIQQQQQPMQMPPAQLDGNGFMQQLARLMQPDANGTVRVGPDYIARITTEIAQAFGRQLNTITDILGEPNMINFAVQAMQRDG